MCRYRVKCEWLQDLMFDKTGRTDSGEQLNGKEHRYNQCRLRRRDLHINHETSSQQLPESHYPEKNDPETEQLRSLGNRADEAMDMRAQLRFHAPQPRHNLHASEKLAITPNRSSPCPRSDNGGVRSHRPTNPQTQQPLPITAT